MRPDGPDSNGHVCPPLPQQIAQEEHRSSSGEVLERGGEAQNTRWHQNVNDGEDGGWVIGPIPKGVKFSVLCFRWLNRLWERLSSRDGDELRWRLCRTGRLRAVRIYLDPIIQSRSRLYATGWRVAWISARSARTSAAMLSTIGTARGTTQGSCRPLASSAAGAPS